MDKDFYLDQQDKVIHEILNKDLILDTIPTGILIIQDGIFVGCNQEAVHIFRAHSKNDIIGQPPSILSPPIQPGGISSDEKAMMYISEAMEGNQQVFDWIHKRMDNTDFVARVTLKQIDQGENPVLICTIYDNSEQAEVIQDVLSVVKSAKEGVLSARIRVDKFTGDLKNLAMGINEILDAILLPIGEGNRILAQISDGKIDELIAQTYQGDHEKMKLAVNNVAIVLQNLQKEIARLTEASKQGQLSERGKPEQFKGAYADVIRGTNQMLDEILLPIGEGNRILEQIRGGNLREKVEIACRGDHEKMKDAINGVHAWLTDLIQYVTSIANGDMTAEMGKASDKDQIHEHLIRLRENIKALVLDANMLSQAAVEGKLGTRADATKHQGDFQKIVKGVNDTLDAVINPLNVAADYVDNISKGNIPAKITDSYNGDFNVLKNNLNTCIDAVNLLVSDAKMLADAAVKGALDTRADATKHKGDFQVVVKGVNETLDSVIGPLNVAAEYVDRISKGDIPPKITDSYNGDFNEIKNNLNTCIDAVNLLVSDAKMLADAAVKGALDTRADATKHKGDFQVVVKGVNETLDSVIGPLNVAAEYVDRISKGNIPPKITDSYNGDFNEIKNNLNTCIDAVNLLVSDAKILADAAVKGALDTRADATKHQGDFQNIVKGVNDTLDAVIIPLNVAADYVDNISKGNIPAKITDSYNGDFNVLKNNLNSCIDAVNLLVSDAAMLSKAAVEGKLATRADASKHQGDFQKIVKGVNDTLDAVINPLNVAADYVDNISKGNIPAKITDSYNGDFNVLKNNLNSCIDAVNLLVSDAAMLSKAAVEGKLATRADASKHQGDFQKIVKGVNDTLDAVINPLNVAADYVDNISKGNIPAKITDSYNGDFNVLKNNLNSCIDAVNLLVSDAAMLSKAAVEGKLATRADASKHQGDFQKIVKGVNDTLDAVINPLNVAAKYVDNISKGNIPAKIMDSYNGDFNVLKNNLNACIDAVNLLVADAIMLAQAAVDGKLETRADASKHQGDFQKIVKGVNDTLDSVVIPVNEALRVSKEYANYQFKARVDPSLKVAGDWVEFKSALDNIGIQVSGAVGLINRQLLDLSSNAEEASASIEEVSAGAEQIAQSAGGVSKNAELGHDGISQVLKAMEDLNTTVGEVSQRAEHVSTAAVQANEFSKNGIDLAKKSESSMTEITRSSSEVDLIVKEINTQMEEIGKIVRLISDIANQTNLLALNAAIEAARAGDAGRGFAVVAAEVKSLAQDSRKSAENIADMIATLQDKAQKATVAMSHAGVTVAEGSKSLTETLGAFNKIASSIEDITRNAMDVASASEEQAATVEEVTASINEVSNLIIDTAKEAGDAAAATEEASASIDQISKVVTNVSGIADSVAREMSKFVV